MEPHTWPKEASAERFAELLAHHLAEALGTNAFDALVLAAHRTSRNVATGRWPSRPQRHLKATIDKDLVRFDAAEIRERLIDAAFPPEPSGAQSVTELA